MNRKVTDGTETNPNHWTKEEQAYFDKKQKPKMGEVDMLFVRTKDYINDGTVGKYSK